MKFHLFAKLLIGNFVDEMTPHDIYCAQAFLIHMQFTIQHTDVFKCPRTYHLSRYIPLPVGTALKAVQQRELYQDVQAEIILANTYHLYLRPGLKVLEKSAGLDFIASLF